MRIPGEIPKITGVYEKQKSLGRVEKTSAVSSKKDIVSISNQAKDFQTVQRALRDVPDVRQDKVFELTGKYETGQYNTSGTDIAESIVKSVFDKKA
jgi:negative regulator of flagellin synthesis FlgM